MFTGIISHTGRFVSYQQGRKEMRIAVPDEFLQLDLGESVSVNGACLSIVEKSSGEVSFNLSEETIQKTNLASCRRGDLVNLEKPLSLSSLLSGHLVSGHIDRTEKVQRIISRQSGIQMAFSLSPEIRSFLIPKGSIAVNGVSLTISSIERSIFEVSVIPITLKNTNLKGLKRGDVVNVECDIIGKYLYNWMLNQKSR